MKESGAMATTAADLYWDPLDAALRENPYPTWRRLRDEAPVWWNERHDFWVLSRFRDVEAAHKDVATFSSSHGTVVELMTPEPVPTGQMIFLDPPDHTRLRTLVSRAFTPRRIAVIEARVRSICAELLDAQAGHASFDYVQDFGAIVPPSVISSLLGVPRADREALRHSVDEIFHVEDGVSFANEVSLRAQAAVHGYLAGQLRDRRDNPRDDLLSALAHAEVTGDDGTKHGLSLEDATDFAVMLFIAGTETVARLLGWACAVLADHPDQRAELVADPALIPNAVEELLRYEAPSPVQARWCNRDAVFHGRTIPGGSKVVLLTGSAGRDERQYADPDRFDIRRSFDHHVSFGYGIHFCIGAALARMEGRVAIEETLRRHPTWDIDHDNAALLYTSTVRGYERLPISVS